MDKSVALLLVKAESKRLPQKNTRNFHGDPMFLRNVEKCLRIFDKVYVSSDSPWILELAETYGAIPIQRSSVLCGDTPNIPVYQHALQFMNTEAIVAVQANSPTINQNIIGLAKKLRRVGSRRSYDVS